MDLHSKCCPMALLCMSCSLLWLWPRSCRKPGNSIVVSLFHKLKPQWKILVPCTNLLLSYWAASPAKSARAKSLFFTYRAAIATDVWVDASCQIFRIEWQVLQLPGEQCIRNRWLSLLYPPVSYPECYFTTLARHLKGQVTHYFVAFNNQPVWVFSSCSSFLPQTSDWLESLNDSMLGVRVFFMCNICIYLDCTCIKFTLINLHVWWKYKEHHTCLCDDGVSS